MSEYRFVEEPFLTQLEALGWDVIDQGEGLSQRPLSILLKEMVRPVIGRENF